MIQLDATSVVYLRAEVTASVTLAAQVVEIALVPVVNPGATTWRTAAWQGTAGQTRTCAALYSGDLPPGAYQMKVRVTDSPEIPVLRVGVLELV